MDVEATYKKHQALQEGHFLLSSGNHSSRYLQSAKLLENPKVAKELTDKLAKQIVQHGLKVDTICSPAIGGLIAGFSLATSMNKRYIFAERVSGDMTLRRGFEIQKGENILICEDIITTGGSAMECAKELEKLGANIVGFACIANRGFCKTTQDDTYSNSNSTCVLYAHLPLFALGNIYIDMYAPDDCPMCKSGKTTAFKPGSRAN
jgi:orotate phosphoribosyltransferase